MGKAIGGGKDYKTRDKAFLKAAKERGWIALWECPHCGRKNFEKHTACPRCKAIKP